MGWSGLIYMTDKHLFSGAVTHKMTKIMNCQLQQLLFIILLTLTFKFPHGLNCNVTRFSVQSCMCLHVRMSMSAARCYCENVTLDLGSGSSSASGRLPTRTNGAFYWQALSCRLLLQLVSLTITLRQRCCQFTSQPLHYGIFRTLQVWHLWPEYKPDKQISAFVYLDYNIW